MKVLITTDLFKPAINGVVTSILNLEKELTANGHEVRILTVSDQCHSYQKQNAYYIMSLPMKIYPDIRFPVARGEAYIRELIQWSPDVVHSQCEFFSFGPAKRIAKATGAVLVHTYHTLYEQYTEYVPVGQQISRAMLGRWMRARLRQTDVVIAPTRKVEHTLLMYGMNQEIRVIPSGIEQDQFKQEVSKAEISELKKLYGISKEEKVLLSLGRLGYEKQVDELINGVKRLVQNQKAVHLLIVGDGPARESLEQLVTELKLESHVTFTGMVKPEKIAAYYRLGDVFVCASTSETQGLTYIEAMASGLPLVCRKDPCLYGVLEEYGNGFTYENLEEMEWAVSHILTNESWRNTASVRSKRIAEAYNAEEFGENVMNCYYEAISKGACVKNESIAVCEKPSDGVKKWRWQGHGYARRVS